jgi:hypothetical protein
VLRIAKPVLWTLAAIYLLVDAVLLPLARPIGDWIARRTMLDGLHDWIAARGRYTTLALFLAPLIVLEPVKPVAALLATRGHVLFAVILFGVGEMLKLVLVERMFRIGRDKLLSIAAFAFAFGKYRAARRWLEATAAWRSVHQLGRVARLRVRHAMRRAIAEVRHRPCRTAWQPR